MDGRKTTIAPMLSVRNGAKAIEFYKAAFGAGELFRVDNESGEVVARLSVGEAEFWLADESPEHANFSPESLGRRFRADGDDGQPIRTRSSTAPSLREPPWFGPSATSTAGA